MTKLEPVDVEEIRAAYGAGATVNELATAYLVTERHVRRLVADVEPPRPVFRVDPDLSVKVALEEFLSEIGVGGDARESMLAAVALALAARLDRAGARDAPALARTLVDTLAELEGETAPDALDLLKRRHDARRLALAVGA